MSRQAVLMSLMGLFLVMGVGCCPLTRSNISVQLDKSFQDQYGKNRDVDVDIVTVKEAEDARWKNYSMTDYWKAGDGQRKSPNIKTLHFSSASLEPQVIKSDDPIWATWLAGASDKHAPMVYVMVQLPGTWDKAKDDKPGSEDPRRQVISTKACDNNRGAFDGPPTVRLVIGTDRVSRQ